MEPLGIEGAWLHRPRIHRDDRGSFLECFRAADLTACTGRGLALAQVGVSVSSQGVLRGIHFADVPPGQAKYVTCTSGEVLDVVVDIRQGSPTFGSWRSVRLDEEERAAVFVSEGLGHAFMALTEGATLVYMCSQPYAPEREHGIDPLDPECGIEWPGDVTPVLSNKDRAAPGLSDALATGLLPSYRRCQDLHECLASADFPKSAAGFPHHGRDTNRPTESETTGGNAR
ncbi:dTDP-4-dehydrorhamnose 3,5-epimerase [Streptomonospora arabica]|uniref:dTDP-4-dehydrorhamnose 3,5-epimerase family protein n=1 Tax=Streptomonospora arabica TaxID=412417 RepID=A0ABV9SFN9_9ACTN